MEGTDFIDQVQDIITVGESDEIAAGGEITFTGPGAGGAGAGLTPAS